MSLVSPKNFAGPFSNKTHLVTMILIAALFGAYRVAGGGISTERKGAPKKSQVADRPSDTAKKAAPAVDDLPGEPNADLIVEMIGPESEDQPKVDKQGKSDQNTGFDDLEKSLGIR